MKVNKKTKKAIADSLPFLLVALQNPQLEKDLATEGKKIDIAQLAKMLLTASGWKNNVDFIVPMEGAK
jgi:hypothetical protein